MQTGNIGRASVPLLTGNLIVHYRNLLTYYTRQITRGLYMQGITQSLFLLTLFKTCVHPLILPFIKTKQKIIKIIKDKFVLYRFIYTFMTEIIKIKL